MPGFMLFRKLMAESSKNLEDEDEESSIEAARRTPNTRNTQPPNTGVRNRASTRNNDTFSVSATSTINGDASVRQSAKWRRKTLKLLEKSSSGNDHSEEARRAAFLAAEHFWKLALAQQDSSSHRELWHPSHLGDATSVESYYGEEDDFSYFSRISSEQSKKTVGEKSSDRAVRRGTRRGKREDNEKKKKARGDGSITHAETITAASNGKGGVFRAKKRNKDTGSPFLNDITGYFGSYEIDDEEADAWMCGVCGKAFTTLESADKHEQDHIQQVVNSLPWMKVETPYDDSSIITAEQQQQQQHQIRSTSLATGLLSEEKVEEGKEAAETKGVFFSAATGQDDQMINGQRFYVGQSGSHVLSKIPEAELETSENFGLNPRFSDHSLPQSQPPRRLSSDLIDEVLDEEKPDEYRLLEYGKNEEEEEKREIVSGYGCGAHETQLVVYQRQSEQPLKEGELRKSTSNMLLVPEDWPGHDLLWGQNTLVPRLRSEARFHQEDWDERNQDSSVPRRIDPLLKEAGDDAEPQEALLLSSAVRDYVILADEALVGVCEKARNLILTPEEINAERQLAYLAQDKLYYDNLAQRSAYIKNPNYVHRKEGRGVVSKVQNKLLDAYQLCKEGTDKKGFRDEYNARAKKNAAVQDQKLVEHTRRTLYLNVYVRSGIEVVRNELARLAAQRWEESENVEKFTRFERFRVFAHMNMVRLAGFALGSDFTPRRIAVQLSNDIYRLLTPRLKRRGVSIETEIEYRVGPYFVLAVNVLRIDWRRLLKATHRDVQIRMERWKKSQEEESNNAESSEGEQQGQKEPSAFAQWKDYLKHIMSLTRHDILAQFFWFLFEHTHWLVYQPFCVLCYYTFFGSIVREFILSSVSGEIFYYVEEKGMEMEIEIRTAALQAAFMLNALREIRADSKDRKKDNELPLEGGVLGPLLGPAIPADKDPVSPPPGFEVPEPLEYVGLELDVPVGFRRLRWAMLSYESKFITDALYRTEAKYDNITMGEWNKHNHLIGSPKKLPDGVKDDDFLGAEKVASYLMPKSAFVKANMCTETHHILAYSDYCVTVKKKALTPDVPYGSTFVAWTQFTIINTGNDSCRLQFSVEPEFPNGPPMVSRQIKSGMRAGVGELFVLIGETIAKYADEYP